ncbi:carboxypeptidase-like regulatory domain-containing protein [Deinococcus multiflagellatus]|uniref:Carboxypeptidase-like regulatory domain-containing protein n=3 Tax=Deinococcus multiflagellatus TaxID=1656887 RepID=A0ABW1ZUY1_9DEIO
MSRLLLLALTVSTLAACGGGTGQTSPTPPAPSVPGPAQPAPMPTPTPNPTPAPAPGAYTVTGRILTESGQPLAGVEVTATHTVSYTYGTAKTDAQGRYTIALPQQLGSWDVVAYRALTACGQTFEVRLAPEVDTPFAGAQGAVRDFVYRKENAPRGKVYDYIDNSDVEIDYSTLEVTFTPDGPNAAGSTEAFTVKYPFGYGLPDMPLGAYFVTASHQRGGQKEGLLIKTRDNPTYAPRVRGCFLPDSHYGPTLELFWKNP